MPPKRVAPLADKPDYKAAWLTPAKKTKPSSVSSPTGMKLWYNETRNPTTGDVTGSWMLFIQTVDKEPNAAVLEIAERYSLIEDVKTSKANQYYLKIHTDKQTQHIVAALQAVPFPIALPVGKQDDFIDRGQIAFLTVEIVDDLLKITGSVDQIQHLLELETVGAVDVPATAFQRKYFTIDVGTPSQPAIVREKVLMLKDLADFWGFTFQTTLLN